RFQQRISNPSVRGQPVRDESSTKGRHREEPEPDPARSVRHAGCGRRVESRPSQLAAELEAELEGAARPHGDPLTWRWEGERYWSSEWPSTPWSPRIMNILARGPASRLGSTFIL